MIRPSLRGGRGPAAPRSGQVDDSGPGYCGTASGGIWCPRRAGWQAPRRRTRRPYVP
jgi:hypothetical protein